MKLFFDEDVGGGVPRALRAVGLETDWVANDKSRVAKGTRDEDWIPYAGANGYLIFSANSGILRAEAQRNLLIQHDCGAVFLTTGQGRKVEVLRLVLNKWDWLTQIDTYEQRPFAFLLTMAGRVRRVDLANPRLP